MRATSRLERVILGLAVVVGTAGSATAVAQSRHSSDAPSPSSSSSSAAVPAPAGVGTRQLDRTEFIAAADAVCRADSRAEAAVTDPDTVQGVAHQIDVENGIEATFDHDIRVAVSRQPDRAVLLAKFVDLDRSDYLAGLPLLTKEKTAALAGDEDTVDDLDDRYAALPDHSQQIADFLKAYGLTDCAGMEDS